MKRILVISLAAVASILPGRVHAPLHITSIGSLDDQTEIYASLRTFMGTQIYEWELRSRGQVLDYELGTVFAYQDAPGLMSVVIPVVDAKTGKLAGVCYLYSRNSIELGTVIENVGRERKVILGEPGRPRKLLVTFDERGRFQEAVVLGPQEGPWSCVKKTLESLPPIAAAFAGPICAGCLVTGFTPPPCIGCAVIMGGLAGYSLYKCPPKG